MVQDTVAILFLFSRPTMKYYDDFDASNRVNGALSFQPSRKLRPCPRSTVEMRILPARYVRLSRHQVFELLLCLCNGPTMPISSTLPCPPRNCVLHRLCCVVSLSLPLSGRSSPLVHSSLRTVLLIFIALWGRKVWV